MWAKPGLTVIRGLNVLCYCQRILMHFKDKTALNNTDTPHHHPTPNRHEQSWWIVIFFRFSIFFIFISEFTLKNLPSHRKWSLCTIKIITIHSDSAGFCDLDPLTTGTLHKREGNLNSFWIPHRYYPRFIHSNSRISLLRWNSSLEA